MKPPQIIFLTVQVGEWCNEKESGRFEVNKPICLSFTAYHPEEWQASWGSTWFLCGLSVVRTILEAIISFFPVESSGAIGSITCSSTMRKRFAKEVSAASGRVTRRVAPTAVRSVGRSSI
ncbi:uncharacterized protein [Blastocystis hominis]|uniref:UBC core domain-containing protein n=1 Tax=Blastocystis hominis TaxID=12968 RepID=D8MAR9_BLAHO|nr:uncharacterized protein [Blastocystis hominis]CBK25158.2 unnamed protein product [Blastocystis hominis]|eukprot:XP_012899206.1 uncharacterized protein [Blastocystis hominis]